MLSEKKRQESRPKTQIFIIIPMATADTLGTTDAGDSIASTDAGADTETDVEKEKETASTETRSGIRADANTKVRTSASGKVTFLNPRRQTGTSRTTGTSGTSSETTGTTYQEKLVASYRDYARATTNKKEK